MPDSRRPGVNLLTGLASAWEVARIGCQSACRVDSARVAAHLILGPRREPFLPALLSSLVGVAETVIVNDNAPDPSPHASALTTNDFARAGRLVVDRTPFTDFSTARNICLRVHCERDAGDWIAFVDSDEVHGPQAQNIARRLGRVPAEIDFVDGYTWHFIQSFDWYMSIERRMSFFRYRPGARWVNPVHEQLQGLAGGRIALPYVYAHYGWVLPVGRQTEKEKLYSRLGAPSDVFSVDALTSDDPKSYFRDWWPVALRFRGKHPEAGRGIIAQMRRQNGELFAATDRYVEASQTASTRLRNVLMNVNYEQRWRTRAINPLARTLCGP